LGLVPGGLLTSAYGDHYAVLWQEFACPERFPRRSGVPVRRPLF
jgi:hypothetical protein